MTSFASVIDKCLCSVREDSRHELRLGLRCRVWQLLDNAHATAVGRNRRVALARRCVEKVLPLWDAHFQNEHIPQSALSVAQRFCDGSISREVTQKELGVLWTACDDQAARTGDDQSVVMVAYAAVQVVRESLSIVHFGCEGISDSSTDIDADPYDHDSAYLGAIAFSGGPTWHDASSATRRLEYWTWWLTEAVHEVCHQSDL